MSWVKLCGTNLLVTPVIILNNNRRLRLLGLVLSLPLVQAGGAGPRQGDALLPPLVGPVGLLYDLGGLVELPLLPVREGEGGEVPLTLS